jgi:hypothetical protein
MKVANTMPVASLGNVPMVATHAVAGMEECQEPRNIAQSVPSEDKSTTEAANHVREPADGQGLNVP